MQGCSGVGDLELVFLCPLELSQAQADQQRDCVDKTVHNFVPHTNLSDVLLDCRFSIES